MALITVYRFQIYDIRSDQMQISKRWGTREAVQRIGGEIIESDSHIGDAAIVESDINGLTAIDFKATTETGFPRSVGIWDPNPRSR